MKKKILLMVGTRPEFLKIICLYINLKKDKDKFILTTNKLVY